MELNDKVKKRERKMIENHNFTQNHIHLDFNCCDESLENTEDKFISKRQVFDIQKIKKDLTSR